MSMVQTAFLLNISSHNTPGVFAVEYLVKPSIVLTLGSRDSIAGQRDQVMVCLNKAVKTILQLTLHPTTNFVPRTTNFLSTVQMALVSMRPRLAYSSLLREISQRAIHMRHDLCCTKCFVCIAVTAYCSVLVRVLNNKHFLYLEHKSQSAIRKRHH